MIVTLPNDFITHLDIDNCIRSFKSIQGTGDNQLHLVAQKELAEFDVQLIAYLMLFKMDWKQVKIHIDLPHNTYLDQDNSVGSRLIQYRVYCYLMTGETVFQVSMKKWKDGPLFENVNSPKFHDRAFVLSEYFIPLLFASRDEHEINNLLFKDDLHNKESNWFLRGKLPILEKNKKIVRGDYYKIVNESLNAADRVDCIKILASMAFIRALELADILPYYMAATTKEDKFLKESGWYAGTLSQNLALRSYDAFEYFSKVRGLFDELKRLPLVYTFVFSQLLTGKLIPALTQTTKKDVPQKLEGLWKFASGLSNGICELAKNAEQHSSCHRGAITALMSTKKSIPLLMNSGAQVNTVYQDHIKSLEKKIAKPIKALLDIQVLDLGERGVAKTLLDFTEKQLSVCPPGHDLHEIFSQDKDLLEKGTCSFLDFLRTDKNVVLNQQSKKAIAHYGLLTSSQQVLQNNGLILACSLNVDGRPLSIALPGNREAGESSKVSRGTRYSIVLPLFEAEPFVPLTRTAMAQPMKLNPAEMKGLEALFDINEVDQPNGGNSGKRFIRTLMPKGLISSDRTEEAALIKSVSDDIRKTISPTIQAQGLIVNLDFSQIQINDSQLLRLLAEMETMFPLVTFVISNISYRVFQGLQRLNEGFERMPQLEIPFWSKDNIVLLFHYEFAPGDKRFYFTDGLWGMTKDDFLGFNKLIAKNHFNATTLTNTEKEFPFYQSPAGVLQNSPAFFNGNVLLPLDLLIKGENKQTIFEYNASVLLENKIKINTIL